MKHLSLKFALFGALFFAPVVFSGCFLWKWCPCEDEPDTFYRITSLKFESFFNTWEAYKYQDVALYFKSDLEYYANQKARSLGGGNLYATQPCYCFDGEKGSKEKIKDLVIKSNKKYQDSYPIEANLAPLMSIQSANFNYPQEDPMLFQKQKIQDFITKKYNVPVGFTLFFDEAPTIDKKHIFTIRYELDNGEVYTYTTPEITFQ